MKDELKYSYSSANTFPMKILRDWELITSCLNNKKVLGIHYQLNPTNRCNFICPFCSCSNRDKELELSLRKIRKIFKIAIKYGCKSTTITGGGEPLMFKKFDEMIDLIYDIDIDIGLVTNGTLLNKVKSLNNITWIRISASDFLDIQLTTRFDGLKNYLKNIHEVIENYHLDWSFSYVLGKIPNYPLIEKLVNFANENYFTHFRIVNDIFIADELINEMNKVKKYLRANNIDDSIVNYQDRSYWNKGSNPCYISILKPVIGADGYIYPCCGTQYALENPSKDYEKLMRMDKIDYLEDILYNQKFFDGSICYKCYYNEYNKALDVLINGLKHETFI